MSSRKCAMEGVRFIYNDYFSLVRGQKSQLFLKKGLVTVEGKQNIAAYQKLKLEPASR